MSDSTATRAMYQPLGWAPVNELCIWPTAQSLVGHQHGQCGLAVSGRGSNLGASSVRGSARASWGQGPSLSRAGAQAGRPPRGPLPCAARACALIRSQVARVVGATHLRGGHQGLMGNTGAGSQEDCRAAITSHLLPGKLWLAKVL